MGWGPASKMCRCRLGLCVAEGVVSSGFGTGVKATAVLLMSQREKRPLLLRL